MGFRAAMDSLKEKAEIVAEFRAKIGDNDFEDPQQCIGCPCCCDCGLHTYDSYHGYDVDLGMGGLGVEADGRGIQRRASLFATKRKLDTAQVNKIRMTKKLTNSIRMRPRGGRRKSGEFRAQSKLSVVNIEEIHF